MLIIIVVVALEVLMACSRKKTDWYNKGVALVKMGLYGEAVKCFDRVIELNPNNADAWTNRGRALVEMGRYTEAIKSHDRAIEISPQDGYALYSKGLALERMGRREEAMKYFGEVGECHFDHGEDIEGMALNRGGRSIPFATLMALALFSIVVSAVILLVRC